MFKSRIGLHHSHMFRVSLCLGLLFICSAVQAQPSFASAHAMVVDETSGEVLFAKDIGTSAPIASMTKLMTAMVVLDARQDLGELLRIEPADLDRTWHTHLGIPVGSRISRGDLLALSLIASDNHAASALARRYPGGMGAFRDAMDAKIEQLRLDNTEIEEPTGLSPRNRASAQDMVTVLRAAARYPEIERITSQRSQAVRINGRSVEVHNTNALVGAPGWDVLLSKTGFTSDAGRCIGMRLRTAGRTVMVVLMGAVHASQRALDIVNIRRWLDGDIPVQAAAGAPAKRVHAQHARRRDGALAPRTTLTAEAALAGPVSSIVETVTPVTGAGGAAQHADAQADAPIAARVDE
jgi:serine-type D-Ala-D-Ala endopeptidase (penicillin-binding protein 7)